MYDITSRLNEKFSLEDKFESLEIFCEILSTWPRFFFGGGEVQAWFSEMTELVSAQNSRLWDLFLCRFSFCLANTDHMRCTMYFEQCFAVNTAHVSSIVGCMQLTRPV